MTIDTHDIDSDYSRLKKAGVTFETEPKYINLKGEEFRMVKFKDPWGNRHMLFQRQLFKNGVPTPMEH